MPPKYLIVPMKFDAQKWARAIASIPKQERDVYGGIIGVNPSTLATWANPRMHATFPFPSMSAFLNTCNALDLDPREFFILNLPEHTNEQK